MTLQLAVARGTARGLINGTSAAGYGDVICLRQLLLREGEHGLASDLLVLAKAMSPTAAELSEFGPAAWIVLTEMHLPGVSAFYVDLFFSAADFWFCKPFVLSLAIYWFALVSIMSEQSEPKIVDVTAIVDSHPLLDEDDFHGSVAERLKHSKEFAALVWDASKEYVQKMNLTAEEKISVNTWLTSKKDKLQKIIVEKLHGLHKNDS